MLISGLKVIGIDKLVSQTIMMNNNDNYIFKSTIYFKYVLFENLNFIQNIEI